MHGMSDRELHPTKSTLNALVVIHGDWRIEVDKLDQIALQLLCATIAKNGINDFGSMLWAAYNGAERMIEFRENKEKPCSV